MNRAFMLVAITIALLFVSATVAAQTPVPTPGPEHKKLAGLVGNWTSEGEISESPFGPAEKWSCTIATEWYPGNFAVVRHVNGRGSVSGEYRGLDIIAYDGTAKTHMWYGVDNQAGSGGNKVSISGDVLTVAYPEQQVKGKTYKFRGTLKGLGSDRLTWVSEYSEDGKTWKVSFHSTDTRAK